MTKQETLASAQYRLGQVEAQIESLRKIQRVTKRSGVADVSMQNLRTELEFLKSVIKHLDIG